MCMSLESLRGFCKVEFTRFDCISKVYPGSSQYGRCRFLQVHTSFTGRACLVEEHKGIPAAVGGLPAVAVQGALQAVARHRLRIQLPIVCLQLHLLLSLSLWSNLQAQQLKVP